MTPPREGMALASTACSLPHGFSLGVSRSYNSRLLRLSRTGIGLACSSPSGSGSSPSGLKSVRNLYLHPVSRGSTVVCSVIDTPKSKQEPDHLLILVHGIMASPKDWTYGEAVLKRRLGDNFFIYEGILLGTMEGGGPPGPSQSIPVFGDAHCNSSTAPADAAGSSSSRAVAKLRKLLFRRMLIGVNDGRYFHGLFHCIDKQGNIILHDAVEYRSARHCSPPTEQRCLGLILIPAACRSSCQVDCSVEEKMSLRLEIKRKFAQRSERVKSFFLTDGEGQVLGFASRKAMESSSSCLSILEKLAAPLAPLIVGRTGAQLFLTDGDPSKPPLLLQMASDCDDKKYILALAAFKNRVLYANVSYDHMVGWRTASLRREKDLVKPSHRSLDGYKHIVNVEYCSPVSSEGPHFPSKAARAKEAAQRTPNRENTEEYHQMMEEEMIHGLQKVGWKKVDVNFHSSFWPYSAHNNIHVKNEWLHNAGAGVIAHVADSIKQQESRACLPANL